MNYPPEIASLLNRCEIRCFRCNCSNWEIVGSKNARCIPCQGLKYQEYGIARFEENDGKVHVYVHADEEGKYGGDRYSIWSDGPNEWRLLESTQDRFICNIAKTLTLNKIPCPVCRRIERWISEFRFGDETKYAICKSCDDKNEDRLIGCGKCPRGTTALIELYATKFCHHEVCTDYEKTYYSFLLKSEQDEEWEVVQEEIKDPGCD